MHEFEERRWRERVQNLRDKADQLEQEGPTGTCQYCGHIPYPITATQHCWCDPADFPVTEDADA